MIRSAYDLAQRYVGIRELAGAQANHPLIQWWLSLCGLGTDSPDETPWCMAFVNGICWECRLPRSKSARARSGLTVGVPTDIADARPENDIVIIKRGEGEQPGPEVIAAPGHVGFFARREHDRIWILGGNQSDGVTVAPFPTAALLGVRRLA